MDLNLIPRVTRTSVDSRSGQIESQETQGTFWPVWGNLTFCWKSPPGDVLSRLRPDSNPNGLAVVAAVLVGPFYVSQDVLENSPAGLRKTSDFGKSDRKISFGIFSYYYIIISRSSLKREKDHFALTIDVVSLFKQKGQKGIFVNSHLMI